MIMLLFRSLWVLCSHHTERQTHIVPYVWWSKKKSSQADWAKNRIFQYFYYMYIHIFFQFRIHSISLANGNTYATRDNQIPICSIIIVMEYEKMVNKNLKHIIIYVHKWKAEENDRKMHHQAENRTQNDPLVRYIHANKTSEFLIIALLGCLRCLMMRSFCLFLFSFMCSIGLKEKTIYRNRSAIKQMRRQNEYIFFVSDRLHWYAEINVYVCKVWICAF